MANDPAGDVSTAMLDVLERIARGKQEFRDEISDWQRNFEVSLDVPGTAKKLATVKKVQTGGGIR